MVSYQIGCKYKTQLNKHLENKNKLSLLLSGNYKSPNVIFCFAKVLMTEVLKGIVL